MPKTETTPTTGPGVLPGGNTSNMQRAPQNSDYAVLKTTHPEYDAKRGKWREASDLYYLEGGYADGSYITAHGGEIDEGGTETEKFKKRKELAYLPAYGSLIVDSRVGHLFKQEIGREITDKSLKEWTENVDGNGTRINDFLRTAMKEAMIYGHVFLFVDMPTSPTLQEKEAAGQIVTVADVQREGLKPYAYMVKPQDVLDWDMDRTGRYNWIKVREHHYIYGNLPLGQSDPLLARTQYPYIRIWTRTDTTLYDEGTGKEISRIQHDLGVVPCVALYNKEGKNGEVVGRSELADVLPLCRALFNRLSEATELFRNQSFSILTIPVASSEETLDKVKVGASRALTYDASLPGGKAPAYISADASNTQVFMQHIEWLVEEIHRIGAIKYMGGIAQSGVAWAFDWEMVNHSLSSKADLLKEAELKLAAVVLAYSLGDSSKVPDSIPYTVNYPSSFSLSDPKTEAELAAELEKITLPHEVWKEFVRVLVRRILPDLDAKKADELDKAIDEWEKEEPPDPLSMIDGGRITAIEGGKPEPNAPPKKMGPGNKESAMMQEGGMAGGR